MVLLSIGLITSILLIAGTIYGFPLLFNQGSENVAVNYANKKTASASLTNYRLTFGSVGLFCALLIILGLMELFAERLLPFQEDPFALERFEEELEEIPNTFIPPPPPPKIVQPEPVEVPDEEEIIEQEIIFEEDTIIEPEPDIDIDFFDEESVVEEVVTDRIWDYDEIAVKPTYPGGMKAFYHYIGHEYVYPQADKRLGTEGRIFLRFVIDKNGKVTDVKVLKGINERMDAEAIRIMKICKDWIPGRVGDKNVAIRFNLPLRLNAND